MSSLVILAASVFLRYRAEEQTQRESEKNAGENPATAVSVCNYTATGTHNLAKNTTLFPTSFSQAFHTAACQ